MTSRNRPQQGNNNTVMVLAGVAGIAVLLMLGMVIVFKGDTLPGQSLAATLGYGNTTQGNSIIMNENGDVVSFTRGSGNVDIDALAQSLAAAHAQLPDLGGATDQFVFEDVAQILTNKTLTSPVIDTPTISSGTISGSTLTSPIINNPTINTATISGTTTFSDQNITNVGDIALDSITADGASIIINDDVDMSSNDLTNIGDASTDITSTLARFGVPNEIELNAGGVVTTYTQAGIDDGKVSVLIEEWSLSDASWQSIFEIVIGNNSCAGIIDFSYIITNVSAGETNGGTLQMVFARRTSNNTKNTIYNHNQTTVIHVGSSMVPTFATTLTGGATSDPQDLNFWVTVNNGNNTNMNMMFKAEMTSVDADGNSCDMVMQPY